MAASDRVTVGLDDITAVWGRPDEGAGFGLSETPSEYVLRSVVATAEWRMSNITTQRRLGELAVIAAARPYQVGCCPHMASPLQPSRLPYPHPATVGTIDPTSETGDVTTEDPPLFAFPRAWPAPGLSALVAALSAVNPLCVPRQAGLSLAARRLVGCSVSATLTSSATWSATGSLGHGAGPPGSAPGR
jgi:hypothetical protein